MGALVDIEPGEYPDNYNAFGFGTSIENIQNRNSGTITYFESPQTGDINTAPAADVANDYAQIVFGWVRPEVTGDYRFFLATDDNGQLYLSTDDDPANAELIADEPVWNGVRIYDDTADPKEDNWSESISLVAGEEYYIEARHSEGGGGDNLAVAWTFTTDGTEPPLPANGSSPIPAPFLLSNVPIQAQVDVVSTVPAQDATGVYFDAGEFSVTLRDGLIDQVDPATVSVTVGGANVEVSVDSTDEGVHTIEGTLEDPPLGETVDVVVAYTTLGGDSESVEYSFSVETMETIDPAWAVGLDQGTERGFDVRVVQAADAADRGNSAVAGEAQLNNDNPPAIFEGSGVFDVINFNQDVDDGTGGNGLFRGGSPTASYQIADTNMKEVGLLTGDADVSDTEHTNEWAMEVKTYLAFPEAGVYTMGVNSDDGFRVTAGSGVDRADSQLELGIFDGGRGAANDGFQSIVRFQVEEAGIYAVRFIGYEGGGGSSMEWYSIDNFGTEDGNAVGDAVLINADGGIMAYTGRASEPGE